MKRYILWIMVLLVPGACLWAMTVDKEQEQVASSLIQEIERGASEEELQLLLQNGADINEVNDDGRTPLYVAVAEGNEEVAAFLVSRGADVNGSSREKQVVVAPLERAILDGKLSFVIFLVAYGAYINGVDRSGYTALMGASLSGYEDIVAFLLMQADLDICYRLKSVHQNGDTWTNKTILDIAYDTGDLFEVGLVGIAHMISNKIDLIKRKILWLSSLRAPEGLSQPEQEEWLERLKAKIKRRILQIHTIDIADENGSTPLHKAVIAGSNPLAFWILSIQPSLMLRENKPILRDNESEGVVSGETPIYYDVTRRDEFAEFTRKCIEMCKEEIQQYLDELEKKKKVDHLNG